MVEVCVCVCVEGWKEKAAVRLRDICTGADS